MENCYKILGVSPSATIAEIKRAYRKKVKELHPDTSLQVQNTEAFHQLVRAYEVLSDAQSRSLFDMAFAASGLKKEAKNAASSFDYRSWLLARTDEKSRAKLIIFDLLHNREDDAVCEYVRLSSENMNFSLENWFNREEFMDLGFILSEELVFRKQYYDAAFLLIRIVQLENEKPYFRHFFSEVLNLLKDILLFRLEGCVSEELALDVWEKSLEIGFERSYEAKILIKMAQAYILIGDEYAAKACFEEALRNDKKIKVPENLYKYIKKQY